MEKIKVVLVFGTRPEAIKMIPLVKELQGREEFETIVCVTAQHRQMLDQVLEIFDLTPEYDLDIMCPNQTLSMITSNAMIGVEKVIKEVQPHIVLVHGDTTTSFASALSAFYNLITQFCFYENSTRKGFILYHILQDITAIRLLHIILYTIACVG